MNIIILAAGMGTRLKEKTKTIPKCLIEVNGEKIINRFLKNIKILNPNKIIIVTGHLSNVLEKIVSEKWGKDFDIEFIKNEIYDKTNNIYSLWLANKYMASDYMIVEGDVFVENNYFKNVKFNKNLWFVDKFTEKNDGCMLTTNNETKIKNIEIIRHKLSNYSNNLFKSTGIVYIHEQQNEILDYLKQEVESGNTNIYYDLLFAKYINKINININNMSDKKWFEIDNQADLTEAEKLFKQ